jgi:hypothetical protein
MFRMRLSVVCGRQPGAGLSANSYAESGFRLHRFKRLPLVEMKQTDSSLVYLPFLMTYSEMLEREVHCVSDRNSHRRADVGRLGGHGAASVEQRRVIRNCG